MKTILRRLILVSLLAGVCSFPAHASPTTNVAPNPALPNPSPVPAHVQMMPPPNGPVPGRPPINPLGFTQEQWSKLNAARSAAMKANPDLLKQGAEIAEKMRAFQEKLQAAMLKTNPNIAPTLAKLQQNRPPLPPSQQPAPPVPAPAQPQPPPH